MDLDHLLTEQQNQRTAGLDRLDTLGVLAVAVAALALASVRFVRKDIGR